MEHVIRPVTGAVADLPRERAQFKELLLDRHFRELKKSAEGVPPSGDTAFEQLVCVGYQPQLKQLNAVVSLKQSNGYSGNICSAGSTEYVKFFASTDDGASWTELGLTSFTAWDVPGPHPLEFDVTLGVDLAATCCATVNLVLVRAILSWEVPPTTATAPVVWGNGLDAHIQVAPLAFGTLADLFECLEIPIEISQLAEVVPVEQAVEFGSGAALSPAALHELYATAKVPQHRYLLAPVASLLSDPVALSTAAADPDFELLAELKDSIDLSAILAALADPQGDEAFEELGCVGLNPATAALVATVHIKRDAGYSGTLCTAGSSEYVAFWADWGSGWEYAGTSSVTVHDIPALPSGGLQYAVSLPFGDAITRRRPCTDGPQEVTIRAVLSWATPPSSTDPYALPVWGGHLQSTVLVAPGQPVSLEGGPDLESIGAMPVDFIDASGLATGQSTSSFVASASPFGGRVEFKGHVINSSGGIGGPGLQYRILTSPNAGATPSPMIDSFGIQTHQWLTDTYTSVTQTPAADGWVTCQEDYAAAIDVVDDVLGHVDTSGDGKLWISMEVRQGTTVLGQSPWKLIRLDNTAPNPVDVAITSGGGSCGDFSPGALIQGTYSAVDNEDLRAVSIGVEMAMPGATLTKVPATSTPTSEAGTWSLQTLATTQPCGYTIVVTAVDNTIVDSAVVGWFGQAFTGLCLRPSQA